MLWALSPFVFAVVRGLVKNLALMTQATADLSEAPLVRLAFNLVVEKHPSADGRSDDVIAHLLRFSLSVCVLRGWRVHDNMNDVTHSLHYNTLTCEHLLSEYVQLCGRRGRDCCQCATFVLLHVLCISVHRVRIAQKNAYTVAYPIFVSI